MFLNGAHKLVTLDVTRISVNNVRKAYMKIAILMMQKNESELLDKWLRYHGYLVGFENLYVYDNGSDDLNIQNKLQNFEVFGVNVEYGFNEKCHFESKGEIFCERIKELEVTRPEIDFFIPLDCDEFLGFLDDEGNVSCDKSGLYAMLSEYKKRPELLLVDSQYYNTSVSDVYFNKQPYRKCFFYKNTIKSLDVGFHWGKVTGSDAELKTQLVHFHFHNKPFAVGKAHAREKLKGRVANFEPQTIAAYKGAGLHLVRFFTQDESSYVSNQLNLQHIYSAALKLKFDELGLAWPYSSELIKSRNELELNTPQGGFQNLVPYFSGSIDFLGFDDNSRVLTIKGWGVFQKSVAPKIVYLRFSSGVEIKIVVSDPVQRTDVSKMLNMRVCEIGFEETIKIPDSVKLEGEFSVIVKSDYRFQTYQFDIGKKYQNLFSNKDD